MQSKAFPVIDVHATGQNIQRLRKARGLTVRDVQNYFGFDEPRAIYKWQSGRSLPTVDNLYALSALLDTPIEDILVQASYHLNIATFEQRAEPGCSVVFYRLVWHQEYRAYAPMRLSFPIRLGQLA